MESFEQRENESQVDEGAGGSQPDPAGTETAPITAGGGPEATEETSEDSGELSREAPVVEGTDLDGADDEDPTETESSDPTGTGSEEPGEEGGLLVGTGTEQQPGVGGSGDHPAPAVMRDPETGEPHSAGRPPSGWGATETAPASDTADLADESHAQDEAAREKLNAESEPDQIETDRPDIGTE